MHFIKMIAPLAAVAGLIFGTSVVAAQDGSAKAGLDQLYGKVKASNNKKLVIFSAYPTMPQILDEFRKDYPEITIAHEVASGATLLTRLQAEKTSGNYAVDVVSSGPADLIELENRDLLQAYIPHSADKLPASLKTRSGVISVPFRNLFALTYNPNLVPEKEVPNSLDQMLDKKWSGKLAYATPTGANAFDNCAATLWYNKMLSEDQLQKIHDQGRGMQKNTDVATYVAQGRFAMGIWGPSQTAWQLQKDNAPVRVKYLPNGSVLFGPGLSLLAHAPNSDAGKLFMEWLYTPRGQRASNAMTAVGTMPNAPAPAEYPDISGYDLNNLPLEKTSDLLKEFRVRTKAIWKE